MITSNFIYLCSWHRGKNREQNVVCNW